MIRLEEAEKVFAHEIWSRRREEEIPVFPLGVAESRGCGGICGGEVERFRGGDLIG